MLSMETYVFLLFTRAWLILLTRIQVIDNDKYIT